MHRVVLLAFTLLVGTGCGDDQGDDDDDTGIDPPTCGDDPGETQCGAACCSAGQRCLDQVCCPGPLQCGTSCCSADRSCIQGFCSDCATELCQGQCCRDDWGCTDTGCCPMPRACGGICCGETEVCEAGACVHACSDREERCGPLGAPECCVGKDICRWDQCVTPLAPCHDDSECPPEQTCDPDRLRCIPRLGGDAGTDAGAGGDAGVSTADAGAGAR